MTVKRLQTRTNTGFLPIAVALDTGLMRFASVMYF